MIFFIESRDKIFFHDDIFQYHVEPSSTLVKAPIIIRNTTDPINESLMRFVADELGDEWRIVANHLNLSKPRIQVSSVIYLSFVTTPPSPRAMTFCPSQPCLTPHTEMTTESYFDGCLSSNLEYNSNLHSI